MLAIIHSKIFCFPVSYQKKLKIKKYKAVILPFVLYGYETLSLTLREECRLRVFENSVLRIFGPESEEDGLWTKLHKDEVHSLYSLPNIVRVIKSRRMRLVGCVACVGEGRHVYRVLVWNPKWKRPLGRPKHKWEDDIKMDCKEIWINGMNWIWLA
jgi:hypothetical protein